MKTQRQWDKFCVWVALVGGNLAGILSALPALIATLRLTMWSTTWNHDIQRTGFFVLLATVNCLVRAPRRLVVWVLAPLFLWLIWNAMDTLVTRNWTNIISNLYSSLISVGIALVITSGIALLTGKFGQGREELDAAMKIHFESQKGTWPPAPRQP